MTKITSIFSKKQKKKKMIVCSRIRRPHMDDNEVVRNAASCLLSLSTCDSSSHTTSPTESVDECPSVNSSNDHDDDSRSSNNETGDSDNKSTSLEISLEDELVKKEKTQLFYKNAHEYLKIGRAHV